ncbi:hypothetical protein HYH02_003415 [Chlamydomonas schloesseri]|uniref:Voltage-gated Ca2+ channel, alpha subunit n=1 Tax=Chlamydomonas schloesseri TaxID=2026947 RepID=A0A835WS69_9CHLO|nr:hypothetical protein HYH02_003415 [Chlamydomonas schloesseri]|eukprot:KAG2451635.1 hypothetical protein HYH02_003415 [Chlamydomonas schloesseri]
MAPNTYLRDGWNVLDFLVVVSGFVNLAVPTNLTGLRTIRALRPLRTVNRVRGMKVLVTTMLSSLPMLMDVFVLCAFCFFVFGIIAVQLFAGVLRYRCGNPDFSTASNVTDPSSGLVLLVNVSYVVPEQEAEAACSGPLAAETTWYYIGDVVTAVVGPSGNGGGRVCEPNMYCTMYGNPNYGMTSYDHILWSWLTIFQHITLSGWTDTMYMTQDAVSFWVWPFYLALVIFGSFFMINLALAVLSINFSTDNLKEEQSAKAAEQNEKRWLSGERQVVANRSDGAAGVQQSGPISVPAGPHVLEAPPAPQKLQQPQASAESEEKLNALLLLQSRHKRHEAEPDEDETSVGTPPPSGLGPVRRTAWRLSVSRWLEVLTAVVIIANTVLMCINWFEMPESVERATNYINYVFTIYFLVEMIMKMTGFGLVRYFRDGMNTFDCLVVLISVTEMILDIIPSVSGLGPLSVLRAFRLLRIFRLARSWRDLNIVVRGMFNSVKASFMLVLLMVLFLFIAALVGMQLFGYKFMFCDYVEGAAPVCPLGWDVWGQCPNHFYCYLPCTDADYGTWINATGSNYNDLAYCERFCANDQAAAAADVNSTSPEVAAAGGCEYLAQVGKPDVPRANFDNIFWALFSVFQVLTGENWNDVMVNSMRTLSPWASLYFVGTILVGNYLVFNLFIAILLDNLQFTDELRKEDEKAEARKATRQANKDRSGASSRRGKPYGDGDDGDAGGGGGGEVHDGLQLLAAGFHDHGGAIMASQGSRGAHANGYAAYSAAAAANGAVDHDETAAAFRAILLNGQAATLFDNPLAQADSGSLEGEGADGAEDEYSRGRMHHQQQHQQQDEVAQTGAADVSTAGQGQGQGDEEASSPNRLDHAPASGQLPPLDPPVGKHRAQLPAIRNAMVLPPVRSGSVGQQGLLPAPPSVLPPIHPRPSLARVGPGTDVNDPLLATTRTRLTSAAEVRPRISGTGDPASPRSNITLPAEAVGGSSSVAGTRAGAASPEPGPLPPLQSGRPRRAGPVAEARAVSLSGADPAVASMAAAESPREAAALVENASVRGQQLRAKNTGAGGKAASALLAASQVAMAPLGPLDQEAPRMGPASARLPGSLSGADASGALAAASPRRTSMDRAGGTPTQQPSPPPPLPLQSLRSQCRADSVILQSRLVLHQDGSASITSQRGGMTGPRSSASPSQRAAVAEPAGRPAAAGQEQKDEHQQEQDQHMQSPTQPPAKTAVEWLERLRIATSQSQRHGHTSMSFSTSRGEGADEDEEEDAEVGDDAEEEQDSWPEKREDGSEDGAGKGCGQAKAPPKSTVSGALLDLSQAVWQERLQGRALFMWGPNSRFRRRVAQVVFNRWFDAGMLVIIVFSCVALVLDAPGLDPESTLASVLRVLDYFFIAAFTLEALLKIITFGFAFTGKHAYIRDAWNVLDFIIVLAGYALIILTAIIGPEGSSKLKVLRVLRSLRALRPLRAANRFEGLKLVVGTLFAVLPAMGSTLLVCLLFYLTFAILFVNLLKGKLFNCVDPESGDRLDPDYLLPPGEILTREWCEVGAQTINSSSYYNGRGIDSMPPYTIATSWVNPVANFDNVAVGILTLFQVATMSLWLDITFTAVDSTQVGQQPIWNNRPIYCVLFIIFIVVCSFFVLNLFIGVTLDKFAEIQEETSRAGVMLTPAQQAWVSMQKVLSAVSMCHKPPRPKQKLRGYVHRLVTHRAFEVYIMAMIVINVAFMAMVHADMSPQWQDVMSYTNLIFTIIFGIEALLKIVAFGPLNYLRDGWNAFDFFVVLISIVSVVLDFSNTKNLSFMPVLRVLRVVRVLRLVRTAKGMQKLLATLISSLPALANVGGVMLLFFFIYAVIGVNLFAGLKYGQAMDSHANFDTFANAMLLLFRMLTGESWDQVMQDCMVTSDCVLVTAPGGINTTDPSTNGTILIPPGTYLNPSDPALQGLPDNASDNQCALSPFAAAIYFPTFVVLCTFILLQLVIAVLLENLIQADTDQTLPVAKPELDAFVAAWSDLDGHATGLVHASQLAMLVSTLPPPLGTRGKPDCRMKTARALLALDIPLYVGNKVSFVEVLHALTGNVCGTELPDATEDAVRPALARRLPRRQPLTRFTAAHFHAADNVRAAIKGFLLRYAYRGQLVNAQFARQLQGLEEMRSAAAATSAAFTASAPVGPAATSGGAADSSRGASRRALRSGSGGGSAQSRQESMTLERQLSVALSVSPADWEEPERAAKASGGSRPGSGSAPPEPGRKRSQQAVEAQALLDSLSHASPFAGSGGAAAAAAAAAAAGAASVAMDTAAPASTIGESGGAAPPPRSPAGLAVSQSPSMAPVSSNSMKAMLASPSFAKLGSVPSGARPPSRPRPPVSRPRAAMRTARAGSGDSGDAASSAAASNSEVVAATSGRVGSMIVNGRRLSDVRRELAEETAGAMHTFTEVLLQAAMVGMEAEELEARAREVLELSRPSTVAATPSSLSAPSKRSLLGFLGSLGKQQQQPQTSGNIAATAPGGVAAPAAAEADVSQALPPADQPLAAAVDVAVGGKAGRP